MLSRLLSHRVFAVIALLVAAASIEPALAAEPQKPPDRRGGDYPGRTDAGSWDGTWYYVNRTERWVLWMRHRSDGQPEMRLRYMNTDKAESFTTDWAPAADYVHRSGVGRFEFDIEQRDENLIRGAWYWKLGVEGHNDLVRTETATVTLYRTADGRQLAMSFEAMERVYVSEGKQLRVTPDLALSFQKASRRQAHWDELPF